MKINEDFSQRNATGQHDPGSIQRLGVYEDPTLLSHQSHHVSYVVIGADDEGLHHRFFNGLNVIDRRKMSWIVNFLHRAASVRVT